MLNSSYANWTYCNAEKITSDYTAMLRSGFISVFAVCIAQCVVTFHGRFASGYGHMDCCYKAIYLTVPTEHIQRRSINNASVFTQSRKNKLTKYKSTVSNFFTSSYSAGMHLHWKADRLVNSIRLLLQLTFFLLVWYGYGRKNPGSFSFLFINTYINIWSRSIV